VAKQTFLKENIMNYKHLNINERIIIAQLKLSGLSIREIAHQLDRNPSTISRELKRNSYKTGSGYRITRYTASTAQNKCIEKNINADVIRLYPMRLFHM